MHNYACEYVTRTNFTSVLNISDHRLLQNADLLIILSEIQSLHS